jgi:hypothetical protein
MFPAAALPCDELRMRMLTPQSNESPPTSEVSDSAETLSIFDGRALARQMTPPQGTPAPHAAAPPASEVGDSIRNSIRDPISDTQSIFPPPPQLRREIAPEGATRAAPYMIAMAPLRALASLFSNLLGVGASKEAPLERPLGTRYEVQLLGGLRANAADGPYHCRLPAAPPAPAPEPEPAPAPAPAPAPEPEPTPAPTPAPNPYLVTLMPTPTPTSRETFWV